jgi:hypothetical protein
MTRLLAIAALLGLTLAPAAYAQVSCAEMSSIMREAGNDFEDISGEEVDDGVYEATEQIGGADECYVDVAVYPAYYCLFQHEYADSAYDSYGYRLRELRNCLGGWKQTALREEPPLDGDGFRDLEGYNFTGPAGYEGFDWLVRVEQHIEDDEAHYHVRVELSYF